VDAWPATHRRRMTLPLAADHGGALLVARLRRVSLPSASDHGGAWPVVRPRRATQPLAGDHRGTWPAARLLKASWTSVGYCGAASPIAPAARLGPCPP
jgi:hypothetical protein